MTVAYMAKGKRCELTPNQRAALVAYELGQGAGLTEKQITTMTQFTYPAGIKRLLAATQRIADIERVDGTWSWRGHINVRTDLRSRERAILVAFLFAHAGEVNSWELKKQLGISRQAVFYLLATLSGVLPIYHEKDGHWRVCDWRDED